MRVVAGLRFVVVTIALVNVVACSSSPAQPAPGSGAASAAASTAGSSAAAALSPELAPDGPEVNAALDAVVADRIKQHMSTLADDAMEGRGPGSPGYDRALEYVESTLKSYGVAPAGDNGGFRQRVPLRNGKVVEAQSAFRISVKGRGRPMKYGVDFLLGADLTRDQVDIKDATVVFVGYGVSAPGLGYDDYASAGSLDGKVVAFLSGAPASLPSNERAHYSSGAVKDAEAAKRGAIGTISFTSPDDPRFRWDVSVATNKQGGYAWVDAQGNTSRGESQLRGSVSLNHSGAQALFASASKTLAQVFADAKASTPQAFELPARVTVSTRSTHQDVESANLVGRVAGSDPALQHEHVVFVAHVDHFGRGVAMNGDEIYNGAHDNASGTAIVMEVAKAFTTLPVKPRRSTLFLFVTAEERGLLGSDYFARNPTVPKEGIVADLTLDMPFMYHPLLDIVPYGTQHSSLKGPVEQAAQQLGIEIGEDPIPEQALFIRSDHYSFVKQGVPSLFIKSGFKTGSPDLDGGKINAAYRRDVYHKPNDDMSQAFDFGAGASHAKLNFLVGWLVAQAPTRPTWNRGDFFGGLYGQRAAAAH